MYLAEGQQRAPESAHASRQLSSKRCETRVKIGNLMEEWTFRNGDVAECSSPGHAWRNL
jgi:hypothetical protein